MTQPNAPTDLRLLAVSFGAIFVAELGDKTQLTTLTFAADSPGFRMIIFAAAAAALVASALLGVLLGDLLARFVKPRVLNVIAAGIFLVCAVLFTVRFFMAGGDGAEAEQVSATEQASRSPWAAFALTFAAIFVAELGDKTQLATLSLAAGHRHARWLVFAGSSVALIASAALAAIVGGVLGDLVRSPYLGLVAAAVFALLGLAFLFGWAEKGKREFRWLAGELERMYEREHCRQCVRFMRLLEHVEDIGSDVVTEQVEKLLAPQDQWQREPCGRRCFVDDLHERLHEKLDHEDTAPLRRE